MNAGVARGRQDGRARLRRPEPRRARRREDRLGGDLRRLRAHQGRRPERSTRAPTSPGSTSKAPTSSARSARCRAASATASTSRSCSGAAGTRCCSTTDRRPRRRHAPRPGRGPHGFAGCAVSSPTTAGSSTAWRRTCSRSRATRRSTWFEGNFEAYEENRHARLGAEADRPHRISYKKLVRSYLPIRTAERPTP